MDRGRISHYALRVLFFFALILLFSLSHPLIAEGWEEGEPVRTVPLTMNFQPPLNANTLNEFLPSGVILQPITTTIPVTLTIPSSTVTPEVTVTASPTSTTAFPDKILPSSTLSPQETTSETPGGAGSSALVMPITYTTPILMQEDAVSFLDNQVAVVVETNTFVNDTYLEFTPLEASPLPFTTTQPVSITHSYPLIRFKLEAIDATSGQPQAEFPHPARLVLDLRQLTEAYDLSVYTFYLAYQDETDPNRWIETPILIHQPGGLISVELTHFSEWAAGVRPERWNPAWNPPTVSEFSGAVTYNYPIETPPGRHGMQPNVALSYSSAAFNGRIHFSEHGVVADGWSLAEISVVRVGVKTEIQSTSNGDEIIVIHPDQFRLVLNGSGHELQPDPSANTTTDALVRYYAKDAPSVRVFRYFDAGAQNTEKIVWLVDTGDGTRYRLGYYSEAEEWQRTGASWQIQVSGHPGLTQSTGGSEPSNRTSAIAWHVDTVTDTFGNQMQYHYRTSQGTEVIRASGTNTDLHQTTRQNRIFEIRYNYPQRYTGSIPAPWNVPRPSDISGNIPATLIQFRAPNDQQSNYATWPITSIYIYHGNLTTPMVEYRITAQTHVNYALGGTLGCYETDYERMQGSHTRVVNAIQQWTDTDADPVTNDGGYTLPATTFSYTILPNYHREAVNRECFRFEYMSGYSNGYGGSVSFLYEHDGDGSDVRGRAIGDYSWNGPLSNPVPSIGYSYHVKQTSVLDGRNSDPVITTYLFTSPCYDQTDPDLIGNWGGMPGASRCYTLDSPQYSGVTGFKNVTITLKDYDNNPVNVRKMQFHLEPSIMRGKNQWSELYKADGTTLMQRSNTYYHDLTFGPTGLPFRPVWYTTNTQYSNGASSPSISTKTAYGYDITKQGNHNYQYGNVTDVWEYSDAAAQPYRHQEIHYYPNSTNWIVNKPGITALYEGSGTTLINATYLTYDSNDYPSQAPTKGAVARSAQARPISCSQVEGGPLGNCSYARQTIEQTFVVNAYGNQTESKSYTDYGYRQYNSSNGLIATTHPTQWQKTTIAYETTYNLYPISVTNALNQVTSFQIYGFNGVALNGFQEQRGLLKKVTNPNGTTSVYEYDPFGRLFAVYENEDDQQDPVEHRDGQPVSRYRYWDNPWNNGTSDLTVYLDPANNKPFFIASQTRPNVYTNPNVDPNSPGYEIKSLTFYDGLGRVIQEHNPWASIEGQSVRRDIVVSTAYNAQGLPTCQTVPYDVATTPRTSPNAPSPFVIGNCLDYDHTTTVYDNLGRTETVTSPGSNTTTYTYTVADYLTVDGYTKLSLTQTEDPKEYVVNRFTNSLGQLVLVRDFSGTTSPYTWYSDTRYSYDLMGNLTDVRTSLPNQNQPTSFLREVGITYDNFGRKTSMDDPDMGVWSYTYDALGNLTRQTDQKGQALCFYYDGLNRLLRKVEDSTTTTACPTYANSPGSGSYHLASYTYDIANMPDPYGVGQVAIIKWGADPNNNYDSFSYEPLGRLKTQTRTIDGHAFTMTTLTWDSLNRPLTIRTPHWIVSGSNAGYEVLTFTYDHEGENTLDADNVMGHYDLVNNVRYNLRGQMTFLDRGGFDTEYSYWDDPITGNIGTGNNDGRLRIVKHGIALDGLPDFKYFYDVTGNIEQLETYVQPDATLYIDTQLFDYDHLHRLISASGSGGSGAGIPTYTDSYTYSGNSHNDGRLGNLSSYDGTSYDYLNWSEKCETFPSQALPHAVRQAGTDYFCYDDNGNMTTRADGSTVYTHIYDVENRLTEVTSDTDDTVTTFYYDAAGQRTRTVVDTPLVGKTITYYPFPNYEEEEQYEWQYVCGFGGCDYNLVLVGTVKRSTYSLAGQAIATRITDDPNTSNNGLFYFLTDHLGSTTMLTNSSGTPQSSTTAYHLPFGDYRSTPPGNDLTERGFTGHHENRDIGLTYMNARFYVVGIGRFATADTVVPDPNNPQQMNRYTYVLGNPIAFFDPTGHSCGAPEDGHEGRLCAELEREILGSTLVINASFSANYCDDSDCYYLEFSGTSHATILDDNTLLTHDHFEKIAKDKFGLDISSGEFWEIFSVKDITLYDTDGNHIAYTGGLTIDIYSNKETSLMNFESDIFGGKNKAVPSNSLPALGSEIAVINWAGEFGSTRVDWVITEDDPLTVNGVRSVITHDGTLESGASGGGVYFEGYLIGNNWGKSEGASIPPNIVNR